MKVETHFALFVSVMLTRLRGVTYLRSRERLSEAFYRQLILQKKVMCAAIAAGGVRRADDIADVYQEKCLRLILFFRRLLDKNPTKLLDIAFNIKAYLGKAAIRAAFTWFRNTAGFAVDQDATLNDGVPDRNQPSAYQSMEATERAEAFKSIHLQVVEKLKQGSGGALVEHLAALQDRWNGDEGWDAYACYLWILNYLFSAEMDESKRRDLSAALIGRMNGLDHHDPGVRASREWEAARNRLDVQLHRLRKRAKKAISQLLPAAA